MRPVYVNYLFGLCVLKGKGRKCPMCLSNIQKHTELSLSPRQPLDSFWEACRDKVLIVTKWFHVKCNNWFCFCQTFHLDVGQICVIQNFSLFFYPLSAFLLGPPNEGHRIFFYSFLTSFQTPSLITVKTPRILQQFPRPVLDSVQARAVAKTKKVSKLDKGAAIHSYGASCDSFALKNKQKKQPNYIQLSNLCVSVLRREDILWQWVWLKKKKR